MFGAKDVVGQFEFPKSDCELLGSTFECQEFPVGMSLSDEANPQYNYLDGEPYDQPLILFRQPQSISQMINCIEEPNFFEPEDQQQEFAISQEPIVSKASPKLSKQVVKKTHKKNSNAIKKIGRVILNFIQKFELPSGQNVGVKSMMRMLSKKAKEGQNPKDFRDRFNLSHLQALFWDCPQEVSKFNLRVAKRLFTKSLRKQILESFQIKGHNKAVYMNTLKCTNLRFCNKRLALRLQLSEILD